MFPLGETGEWYARTLHDLLNFFENNLMFHNKDLFKRNTVWLEGGKNKPGATGASTNWSKL